MLSKVIDNWPEVPVAKIADIILGGTPRTSEPKFWNGDIKWATAKDISECPTKRIKHTEKKITKLGLQKSNAKLLQKGTIVITARGTVGEIRVLGEPIAFNQTCYAVVPRKTNLIDNDFLYYALRYAIKQMKALSYGTVFETITVATFDDLIIPLPSLSEQRKIAEILSSLDDKIELNYEMNKTLEAIAQAIFKKWFVDFEPFKDELVYNEDLGKEIPKEWEANELSNVGRIVTGKTPPTSDKQNYGDKYPFIRIPDMRNRTFVTKTEVKLSEKGANLMKNLLLPSLSICVSCIATTGVVALTQEYSFTNQQINSIVCTENISPYYVYLYLKSIIAPRIADFGSGGSVTPILNKSEFSKLKIILPPQNILNQFHKKIEAIFSHILSNEKEIDTLERIRETLLPKLLSGEIRVKIDIEKEFPEETKGLEEIRKEKARIQKSITEWVEHDK